MQIDKLLYNINCQQVTSRQKFISQLPQQSLSEVQKQMIERVTRFDPDELQSMEEIRTALHLYGLLMKNDSFRLMSLKDESFICSLAFYMSAEKQNQYLTKGIQLIKHQYMELQMKPYCSSINLFKALLETYESIDEQYYEQITLLILKMTVQNLQLLTHINHKYYFLQCLIQIINQESNTQKLASYFVQLKKLYSVKNIQLFHSIDFQILVDILLRTLLNQNQTTIIQQTLKLYLILSQNPIILKDRYRVDEFHKALIEKFNSIDEDLIEPNLKNIIIEILKTN